jgi:acyl-coenzyme A thioesterase PaaI-like protein
LNPKAALSPDELARACAEAMWKKDDASQGLGMEIVEVKPGRATLAMTVRPAHRPWRLHLHAGRFSLRLCLQHP